MPTLLKLALSLAVILAAVQIGKWRPSLAGLIATMPLTGLLVFAWLYLDNPERPELLAGYAKGAVFGSLPSILFFLTAFIALQQGLSFWAAAGLGMAVWLAGAAVHQYFLG
jgi:lipid-A-disaccharide synthase-like uncharacterized protein